MSVDKKIVQVRKALNELIAELNKSQVEWRLNGILVEFNPLTGLFTQVNQLVNEIDEKAKTIVHEAITSQTITLDWPPDDEHKTRNSSNS